MKSALQLRSEQAEPHGFATTAAASKVGSAILMPFQDRHLAALEERALDPELMVRLGVGASNRLGGNCIGIPYFDKSQRVATKYRTITGEKRFTQDAGGAQILWNVDCLRNETLTKAPLVITEGELDAMSAIQAGYLRTVSVPGGAPSTPNEGQGGKQYQYLEEAAQLLRDVHEIILAVDGDAPGANLLHDLGLRLGRQRCKWVRYPEGSKDLNDVLMKEGTEGVQKLLREAEWIRVEGVFRMGDLPPAVPGQAFDCGMVGLSDHYRLRRGDFCVVTGLPGHGKSSFVNEVCCRMAMQHGWNTLWASFEQSPTVDHRRALRSFYAGRREIEMNGLELQDADGWIEKHFSFMVPAEDDDVDLKWVLDRAAAGIIRYGANIVVIDPWNEMDHNRGADQTMTEYVGYAIKQFRKLAKKYQVHLIVVAHPAKMLRDKNGKYPVPGLYDISDSANFANKADMGIVIHRETLTGSSPTKIRVVKSRYHNAIGRPGEIEGVWDDTRTRYTITDGDGE